MFTQTLYFLPCPGNGVLPVVQLKRQCCETFTYRPITNLFKQESLKISFVTNSLFSVGVSNSFVTAFISHFQYQLLYLKHHNCLSQYLMKLLVTRVKNKLAFNTIETLMNVSTVVKYRIQPVTRIEICIYSSSSVLSVGYCALMSSSGSLNALPM